MSTPAWLQVAGTGASSVFDAQAYLNSAASSLGVSQEQLNAGGDALNTALNWSQMSEQQQTQASERMMTTLLNAVPVVGTVASILFAVLPMATGGEGKACPFTNAWEDWAPNQGRSKYDPPTQYPGFEAFATKVVRAAFDQSGLAQPCPGQAGQGKAFVPLLALSQAIDAWNTTHDGGWTRTITRDVSTGDFQHGFGSPDGDPITVALSGMATSSGVTSVSFTVHAGPALPGLHFRSGVATLGSSATRQTTVAATSSGWWMLAALAAVAGAVGWALTRR